MSAKATVPVDRTGPVLAGILTPSDAEDVLRYAHTEAQRRGVTLTVVVTGPVNADDDVPVEDPVARWAAKCPAGTVNVVHRPGLDAAIAVTAATHRCALAVVTRPADNRTAAVVRAIARRAHCPVVTPGGMALTLPRTNATATHQYRSVCRDRAAA